MHKFQELATSFHGRDATEVREFMREHPAEFARFTVARAVYFWMGPPQLTCGRIYLMIARQVVSSPAVAAFAGLWLTLRRP